MGTGTPGPGHGRGAATYSQPVRPHLPRECSLRVERPPGGRGAAAIAPGDEADRLDTAAPAVLPSPPAGSRSVAGHHGAWLLLGVSKRFLFFVRFSRACTGPWTLGSTTEMRATR